ncbi:integrase [Peterkaempfera sp. SMS 1(5)a]
MVMEVLGRTRICITVNLCTHVTQDTPRDAMTYMDQPLGRRSKH